MLVDAQYKMMTYKQQAGATLKMDIITIAIWQEPAVATQILSYYFKE